MNSQEDTYASSLAKLNNEEIMLGSKKKVYKQKLLDKMEKLVNAAWQSYLDAQRSRPPMPSSRLSEIYGIYVGTSRARDSLKLYKK